MTRASLRHMRICYFSVVIGESGGSEHERALVVRGGLRRSPQSPSERASHVTLLPPFSHFTSTHRLLEIRRNLCSIRQRSLYFRSHLPPCFVTVQHGFTQLWLDIALICSVPSKREGETRHIGGGGWQKGDGLERAATARLVMVTISVERWWRRGEWRRRAK